jgi:MFS family permease
VLGIVVALWSVAMVATGAAPTYTALLVSRLGLGVVTAAAMPLVASLIGDFFHPQERGRIYGLILTGEYLGTAGGLLLSGNVAAATSWRFAFWVLVPPGLVLSWLLLRRLDEPARGGRGRLAGASRDDGGDDAREKVSARGVEPDEDRVLRDPDMPLRRAVAWILRVPTNVTLIVASALGYFFFAGLRTFAVSLMRAQFGLSQSAATTLLVALGVAALAGVILGGRIGDRQVERGNVDARVVVPAIAYVGGAAFLLPGLLVAALPVALACFALGGAMLSAANPPLDAARLDIMPSFLWGRAESVRTVLRQSAQALAPLLFGIVADAFGGSGQHGSGRGGLQAAFLIMLIALPASAAVVWRARRHYARDVATAAASEPD